MSAPVNLDAAVLTRSRGLLLGLGLGDALFGPAEFMTPEAIFAEYGGPLREMVGGGWLHLRPGQVTDDTEMALCLANSLTECGHYEADDTLLRYLAWYATGPVDVGGTVGGALYLISEGHSPSAATLAVHQRNMGASAGNGTIMRIAPLAVTYYDQPAALDAAARHDASLTHYDELGHEATAAFCRLLAFRLQGRTEDPATWSSPDLLVAEALAADCADAEHRAGHAPGFVLTALAVATAAERLASARIEAGHSPEDAVEGALIWAGNLGGDADTNAAVTGALLGARWGMVWPQRWLDVLEPYAQLYGLGQRLLAARTVA